MEMGKFFSWIEKERADLKYQLIQEIHRPKVSADHKSQLIWETANRRNQLIRGSADYKLSKDACDVLHLRTGLREPEYRNTHSQLPEEMGPGAGTSYFCLLTFKTGLVDCIEGLNCKRPIPICWLFFKVDLLTDIAALCLTDFIDWRYIHSLVGIFDPACELLLPWTKEPYLCTVAPLSSLWPPPPLPPFPE